jgi:hypothetical protein
MSTPYALQHNSYTSHQALALRRLNPSVIPSSQDFARAAYIGLESNEQCRTNESATGLLFLRRQKSQALDTRGFLTVRRGWPVDLLVVASSSDDDIRIRSVSMILG